MASPISHLTSRSILHASSTIFWASSAIFLGLFGLLLLIHILLAIRYKSQLILPLLFALLLESIGYAIKLSSAWQMSSYNDYSMSRNLFIAWMVLLLSAPFFLRAYIYTLLHRLHAQFLPSTPLLHGLHLLLPILPYFDILPFLLQLFGLLTIFGLIHPSDPDATAQNATYILFSSFIMQFIPLLIFLSCAISFHRKANRAVKAGAIVITPSSSKFKPLLHATYWTVAGLLVRLTYLAYNAGSSPNWTPIPPWGWIFKHNDILAICFDGLPMWVAFVAFAGAHPGKFLKMGDAVPRRGWLDDFRTWRGGNGAARGLGGGTEEFRMESEGRMGGMREVVGRIEVLMWHDERNRRKTGSDVVCN